jgi:hypothetical protein
VATIQGYHEFSRQYAFSYLKGKKVLVVDQQGFKKESIEKDWGYWRFEGCASRGRGGNHKDKVDFRIKAKANIDKASKHLKNAWD